MTRGLLFSIEGGEKDPPQYSHEMPFAFGEKTEILRYAQDDQTTVGWKGGEAPFPVDCRPERSEGSTLFNGGGEGTLLELHPKRV